MASGPGTWTGTSLGLDRASALVPEIVPWQVVLVFLVLWTLLTVLPSVWTFTERRWAAKLDGFEIFRLGAEWTALIRKCEGREFTEYEALQEFPWMIGDMEPEKMNGFIGLSRNVARREKGTYTYRRFTSAVAE
jgi:hypothetical protein